MAGFDFVHIFVSNAVFCGGSGDFRDHRYHSSHLDLSISFCVLKFPVQLSYSFIVSHVLTIAIMSTPCGGFPCTNRGTNNCFSEKVIKIGDVMNMAII